MAATSKNGDQNNILSQFNTDTFYNDAEVRLVVVKQQQVDDDDVEESPQAVQRTLLVSASRLAESPLFAAQLERWQHSVSHQSQQSRIPGCGPGDEEEDAPCAKKLRTLSSGSSAARQRRVVKADILALEDMDAAEACIRHLYSRDIPSGLTPKELADFIRVGDYLGMRQAAVDARSRLEAAKASDLSVEEALAIGYGSAIPEHLQTPALRSLGVAAIAEHLGDVVAVMRSTSLKAAMLALPLEALQDLVSGNLLATDSEDSVVAMCAVWLHHRKKAGADVEREQLRNLVANLRLGLLTPEYFFTVLPAFDLYEAMVEPMQVAYYAMSRCKSAKENMTDSGLPPAWAMTTPRLLSRANGPDPDKTILRSDGCTRQWVIEELLEPLRALMAECPEEKENHCTSCTLGGHFAHGLSLRVIVQCHAVKGLGIFLQVDEPEPGLMQTRLLWSVSPWWKLDMHIQLVLHNPVTSNLSYGGTGHYGGRALGCAMGNPSIYGFRFGQFGPITEVSSWDAEVLVGGELRFSVTVKAPTRNLLNSTQ